MPGGVRVAGFERVRHHANNFGKGALEIRVESRIFERDRGLERKSIKRVTIFVAKGSAVDTIHQFDDAKCLGTARKWNAEKRLSGQSGVLIDLLVMARV